MNEKPNDLNGITRNMVANMQAVAKIALPIKNIKGKQNTCLSSTPKTII